MNESQAYYVKSKNQDQKREHGVQIYLYKIGEHINKHNTTP